MASVDRSPSPVSPPPLPLAPGPRATLLLKLYTDATTHLLRTISYANFAACFPTPARAVPGSLKLLHEQFVGKLGESLGREFESVVREREVVQGLNGLDGIVEEGRRRREKAGEEGVVKAPMPPHTLPPQQLYLSHLAPSLALHSQQLREQQATVQAENAELLVRVMQQRKDIAAMVQGLENVVKDLDGSVVALGDAGLEGLREEVREGDEMVVG
ncbi:hypothetical protein LTR08_003861 [Meristemomyces frigidus]|nr:hypothetical protein LTR08_003861 [Meristemomyces frigidus]